MASKDKLDCMRSLTISVIVPFFNSELYIERCIKSVLAQSYSKWELILIDDGSTDKSVHICKSYSSRDERISYIRQNNTGPGGARNRGISEAKGDYIVFLDSDDSLMPDYLFCLSLHNEDIVFIDVLAVNESCRVLREEYMSRCFGMEKDDLLRSQLTGRIDWGGVRKAVKRDIIKSHDIKYSYHQIGEEAVFSFYVLYYSNTIGFINKPCYLYYQRAESQSRINDMDPWGKAAVGLIERLKSDNLYPIYKETLNALLLSATAVSINRIAVSYSLSYFFNPARERILLFENQKDKECGVDWSHMSFKARVLGFLVARHRYLSCWIICRLRNNVRWRKS